MSSTLYAEPTWVTLDPKILVFATLLEGYEYWAGENRLPSVAMEWDELKRRRLNEFRAELNAREHRKIPDVEAWQRQCDFQIEQMGYRITHLEQRPSSK